jgi:hypothetical protein
MKTLTVQQPWAWAIVEGIKRIENRTWVTPYRGPLLIHAGKGRKWIGHPLAHDLCPEAPPESELIFGYILGGVEIVDCVPVVQVVDDRFASGPFCWILANPWKLAHPVPLAGKLGLFDYPINLTAEA